MRLTNERDQEILKAGISDAAASLLEFMPTMGAGEAITFGEGVALPTRIKFDLLPVNELPRSNTASFTKNWARDMPDDSFLTEVVSRWRAQTYNPDSANYSIDEVAAPAAAVQPVAPAPVQNGFGRVPTPVAAVQPAMATAHATVAQPAARPSLRREGYSLAASAHTATPAAPPPTAQSDQPSLASLIRQFRT